MTTLSFVAVSSREAARNRAFRIQSAAGLFGLGPAFAISLKRN